jgi:hypothetical protein
LHPHPYGLGKQAALGTFFFGVSSSPNLKHTTTYLLAYIILFFCVTFEEQYIPFFEFWQKKKTDGCTQASSRVFLEKSPGSKQVIASIFFLVRMTFF